jgi:hypothetical protein
MSLPARIKFDELPRSVLPKSSTAIFSQRWQTSLNEEGFLDQIVERWRASGIPTSGDAPHQLAMMADALSDALGVQAATPAEAAHAAEARGYRASASHPSASYSGFTSAARQNGSLVRREEQARETQGPVPERSSSDSSHGQLGERTASGSSSSDTLRSLRERLTRPSG